MSGIMIITHQKSYIKIETLRGKYPTESHVYLTDVCGVFTVDHCAVSRQTDHFRDGCESIENDPRPGRLRTSTDEGSVKLVADAVEEDRCATCEELCGAMGVSTMPLFPYFD